MTLHESGDDGPTSVSGERDVVRVVEALLMIADEPMSVVALATAMSQPVEIVRRAIEDLAADYDGSHATPRRAFEVREVGGGWRLYVRPEYDADVLAFLGTTQPTKLSQAALETLAVIAYKQPITRSGVAAIRAVNVDSVVRTLLARGLIVEHLVDPETGAMTYCTSDSFLVHLGINSIDELPLISPLLPDRAEGFDEHV